MLRVLLYLIGWIVMLLTLPIAAIVYFMFVGAAASGATPGALTEGGVAALMVLSLGWYVAWLCFQLAEKLRRSDQPI